MEFSRENLIRIMARAKLVLVIVLFTTSSMSANVWSQNERMSLRAGDMNMVQLFEQLQKHTNLRFVFNQEDVEAYRVDIDVQNQRLEDILDIALKGKPLQYKFTGNHVIISQTQQESNEEITLTGTVKNLTGRPLIGVTVRVKDNSSAVATDVNGHFSLTVKRPRNSASVIIFSYIGFETHEITVTSERELAVVMKESAVDIENVVVTGVFDKPKESFTGSATKISKPELERNWAGSVMNTIAMLEPSLRITENNSQGSNPNALPQISIRGESTLTTDMSALRTKSQQTINTPLIILDGFEIDLQRFIDLNYDDIESITILKDASATSLYGSRGANGVIVITAAKPVAGELTVQYTGQLNLEYPNLGSYNLLNASQKLEAEAVKGLWDSDPVQYQQWLKSVAAGNTIDWKDIPTRTGIGHTHRLNINGGENNYRFNANLSYDDTQGVMKDSYRKVFNGTINLSYTKGDFYINNAFTLGMVNSQDSPYGSFDSFSTMNPYYTPKDENGNWNLFFYPIDPNSNKIPNPAYNASLTSFNQTKTNSVSNNINMRYAITSALRVDGRVGLSQSKSEKDNFKSPRHTDFWETGDDWRKGSYNKNETTTTKYDISATLNYGNTFNEKHILNAGLKWGITGENSDNYSMTAVGFINENLNHISNAANYQETQASGSGPSGQETIRRGVEVVGSVNYNYDMRYFIDATWRADGNSTFGRNSAWTNFWAVGVGWTVSREKFFQNIRFIDVFRIKYSYGVSGSQNFSAYSGNFIYQYDYDQYYTQWLGATLHSFGNLNLDWQHTYQHNPSFDLQMFDGWVELNGAYYNKLTTNSISELPLTYNHGFESYMGNVGKIRNEGWEVSLSTYLVRKNDWQVNVRARFSGNRNTIVKLSDEMKRKMTSEIETSAFGAEYMYLYREGHSLDAIYVLESWGIDPVSGKRIYVNADGNPTFSTENRQFVYAGNKQPKANGSVSAMISYKGLVVNLGFQLKWGGHELNSTVLNKVENIDWSRNIDRRVYTDRWRNPGDKSLYQDIASDGYTYGNTQFVQKNNTFQWVNLNVQYYVPQQWVKKNLGLKNLSLTAFISDLWYNSTIKRERGTSYPYSVSPTFQVSFTF